MKTKFLETEIRKRLNNLLKKAVDHVFDVVSSIFFERYDRKVIKASILRVLRSDSWKTESHLICLSALESGDDVGLDIMEDVFVDLLTFKK